MMTAIAICAALSVLLQLAIFGALANILAALRELVDVTRNQQPILTRPPRYRQ